ncbi:Uncharacterised protein [Serratia liquefaciens]|nr:Uncharacterised protein [Serratia quinivorans]CAI2489071.1 Uncharacterised protein [Serratia liquefaciens]
MSIRQAKNEKDPNLGGGEFCWHIFIFKTRVKFTRKKSDNNKIYQVTAYEMSKAERWFF